MRTITPSSARHRRVAWLAGLAGLALLLSLWAAPRRGPFAEAATAPFTAALSGAIVRFDLGGTEPDGDPIIHAAMDTTLRDARPAGAALPPGRLIVSAYLENFQSGTTPVLPDLLHPDQTATGVGGFMQGKAALLNAAGRVAYRGGLLAEVFTDNSVHLVIDLERSGAPAGVPTTPALRLLGTMTLRKDLTLTGGLRAPEGLTAADVAALRARPVAGPRPPWQDVVRGLAVRRPAQVGTGRAQRYAIPTPPPHAHTHR